MLGLKGTKLRVIGVVAGGCGRWWWWWVVVAVAA